MTELFSIDGLISLLSLTMLEIVLGIDNVIFVSIIMGRMDKADHKKARFLWMIFGIIVRILLLMSLGWLIAHGQKPFMYNGSPITFLDHTFNLKSVIMLAGGFFLLIKTIGEIHEKLEGENEIHTSNDSLASNFTKLMIQVVLIDMVFSFDSIITAIGIANHIEIMATAVVIAMVIMFLFSGKISDFIDEHPTIKMLAMSFLVMVGLVLIMEGWAPEKTHDLHVKNYLYFGMAFSFLVELLNMRMRKKSTVAPVQFHEPDMDESMKI
jgi:predicted tellurium resistance membrane protein TerC